MKLGIMQPYFFPYAGYFELIASVDRWVVFDTVKYNRRSWMNRNRILSPRQGWQYVGVPVRHAPSGTPVHAVTLVDKRAALARLLAQMEHYRRSAPYYRETARLVEDSFARTASDRLVDLNVGTQAAVCEYLQIPFRWQLCSESGFDLRAVEHPGQWALRICEAMGAQTYVNPPGGIDLFRTEEWTRAGIALQFLEVSQVRYPCAPYGFEPSLSILDVLMWLRPDAVTAQWPLQGRAHPGGNRVIPPARPWPSGAATLTPPDRSVNLRGENKH
jgi:hypothetical protein